MHVSTVGRMHTPASPPPEELTEAPSASIPRSGPPIPSTPWAAGSDWFRSSCTKSDIPGNSKLPFVVKAL